MTPRDAAELLRKGRRSKAGRGGSVAVAASQTQIGPIYSLCERKQNRSRGVYSRMCLQGGGSGQPIDFVGFSEFSHVAKVAGPKQNGPTKVRVPSVTD